MEQRFLSSSGGLKEVVPKMENQAYMLDYGSQTGGHVSILGVLEQIASPSLTFHFQKV